MEHDLDGCILEYSKYRKKMDAVQKCGAPRIARSYCAVSEPVVLGVAGMIPIDLLAAERRYVHIRQAEFGCKSERAHYGMLAKALEC